MIINTTPHKIVVGNKVFEPELLLRLKQKNEDCGVLEGIKLAKICFEECDELPDKKEGTYYIVSSIMAQAYPDRNDFLVVGETIRNEKGEIVGCESLSKNPFLKDIYEYEISDKLSLIIQKLDKIRMDENTKDAGWAVAKMYKEILKKNNIKIRDDNNG